MKCLPPLALAALLLAGCGYLPRMSLKIPNKAERIESKLEKAFDRVQKLRKERLLACLKGLQTNNLNELENAAAHCEAELLPIIL